MAKVDKPRRLRLNEISIAASLALSYEVPVSLPAQRRSFG